MSRAVILGVSSAPSPSFLHLITLISPPPLPTHPTPTTSHTTLTMIPFPRRAASQRGRRAVKAVGGGQEQRVSFSSSHEERMLLEEMLRQAPS